MKKIWVIGANGFIGANVSRAFSDAGWEVVGLGRRDAEGLPVSDWVTTEVSRTALSAVLDRHGFPDVLFHAAGSPTVGSAQSDPSAALRDTVGTAEEVLAFIGDASKETVFLYPSSCSVYGSVSRVAIPEETPVAPVSRYGEMKARVENACEEALATAGTRYGVIRYFSVYGRGLRKQLLWDIARKARQHGVVELAGTGEETRDFLHVDDAARLALRVAERLSSDLSTTSVVVNGGSGRATSIAEVATLMVSHMPTPAAIEFSGQTRFGDPMHFCADTARARSLGFHPQRSLADGVSDYAGWVSDRLSE